MKRFLLNFCLNFGYLVLVLFLFNLVLLKTVQAESFKCSSPDAKWNHDYRQWSNTQKKWTNNFKDFYKSWGYLGGFSCKNDSEISSKYYAYIDPCGGGGAPEASLYCEGKSDCASDCGSKQHCVRKADCEDIGGVCIKDGSAGSPRQNDVDCQTGITKSKYVIGGGKPAKWQIIRFRCSKMNKSTCWVKVPEPPETPPEEVNFVESKVSTTTTPVKNVKKQAVINITDCCRNIVPKIDHQTEEYTLNHVIQTAINIYECILCIVGALILIMLVAGSFMIMISAGNDNRVSSGKKIIAGAVVGGIIVFFSFLIVNFTVKALGAQFVSESKVEINPQGPSN